MKALVTGGGGFLGSHIVTRLLAEGHAVRVLARGPYPELEAKGVETLRGDVKDARAVSTAVKGVELVFHVAARVGYWGPYSDYFETNVLGTQNVIDACRTHGVRRLVYTSTPSIAIGEGDHCGEDESAPPPKRYLSSYGPTKAEAERRVLAANGPELRTGAIRPHFIFGPGDPQLVPRILLNARKGTLARIGDGTNLVDITYIDNAVDAHLALAASLSDPSSPCGGQAYFIAQESPVRLWEFVDRIVEGFGAPPIRRRVSFRVARMIGGLIEVVFKTLGLSGEPPLTRMAAVILGTSHYFSHAKAEAHFGYAPKVSIEEGIARMLAAGPAPARE